MASPELSTCSLVIPVYRNEETLPELLGVLARLDRDLAGVLEVVFVIDGSPGLIHSLTKLGLIDEYRLRVHPVVLGSGVLLFKDHKERMPLKPKW